MVLGAVKKGTDFVLANRNHTYTSSIGLEPKGRKRPGKAPGSKAAAVRSLRPHAGSGLLLPESLDWLYTHHGRFVLLCNRCDYDRPRCQRHYSGFPDGFLKWGRWRPTPDDVPAETAFAPGLPSSDHWGDPVHHLQVGIELASLAMATLDVDLYDLPTLIKTAAPVAVTISRGGGPLPTVPCRPPAFDTPHTVVPSIMFHRQAAVLRGTATTSGPYGASRAIASKRSEFTEGGTVR